MPCPSTPNSYGNVLVVTSTTRPVGADLYAGRHVYETDTDRNLYYDGVGWVILSEPWQTYAPQIDQGVTTNIAKTVTVGKYKRRNGDCLVTFVLALTGSGTAGSNVTVTVPVTATTASSQSIGAALVYDSSTTTRYTCQVELNSTTVVGFGADQGGGGAFWGSNPNLALANGDALRATFEYQMTTRYS